MLIIPAIDIKDGCVVRFVQGRLNKKVYSKDPVKTAKYWAMQGAKLVHVVDLDGAMSGKPKNLDAVKGIVANAGIGIEFGGGVRSLEIIKELIGCGVERVVLGTKAATDKNFLVKAFKKFGNKVIVSIDAQEGKIRTEGWKESFKGKGVLTFAKELKEIGFKQIIYTDILKDGTLKGPNIADIKKLTNETGLGIIASGGISSLADIYRLKLLEKQGLKGVIIGKALYEGRFTLKEALRFG